LRGQAQKPCGKELNIVYFTDDIANLNWYNIRRTAGLSFSFPFLEPNSVPFFRFSFPIKTNSVFVNTKGPPRQPRFECAAASDVFYSKILTQNHIGKGGLL
jgi:hypothetical protein